MAVFYSPPEVGCTLMIGVISKMIERFVLAFAGAFELERTSYGSQSV